MVGTAITDEIVALCRGFGNNNKRNEMEEKQPPLSKEVNGASSLEQALVQSLNMDSWAPGYNFAEFYKRVEAEVQVSTQNENFATAVIRKEVIPRIITMLPNELQQKANHQFTVSEVEKAHLGLLFNGGTEASDGTIVSHDTLPLTITQIGICLVSYQGEQGAYAHRIFRKDLQLKGEDPVKEILQLLEERRNRGTTGPAEETTSAGRSILAQRGLMAYAERAILMEKATARWRLGHGNPIPYELLTGYWAGREEMARAAIGLFKKIVEYKRFVFVPSATKRRELISIGNGLKPLEYLVIDTAKTDILKIIENGGARAPMVGWQNEFAHQYGDDIVIGLFKASTISPAYLFYAHRDYLQTAALIAIADGVLQEHRGFPMLIDIADNICAATFNAETFYSTIRNAYSQAGQPFRYLGERETRMR